MPISTFFLSFFIYFQCLRSESLRRKNYYRPVFQLYEWRNWIIKSNYPVSSLNNIIFSIFNFKRKIDNRIKSKNWFISLKSWIGEEKKGFGGAGDKEEIFFKKGVNSQHFSFSLKEILIVIRIDFFTCKGIIVEQRNEGQKSVLLNPRHWADPDSGKVPLKMYLRFRFQVRKKKKTKEEALLKQSVIRFYFYNIRNKNLKKLSDFVAIHIF